MPNVKWSEIDEIIHDCKNTLQVFYGIEKMCQTVRGRMTKELENLNTNGQYPSLSIKCGQQ